MKHGLRAEKYVVLPDEDAGEFGALETALLEELAPVGALQTVLARRIAVAAWRLARADRIEADLFAERSYGADAGPGLALIRDGNGTRSLGARTDLVGRCAPTNRYRGAAMAEFWRALKTLKALQAEQAVERGPALAAHAPAAHPARPALVHHPRPDEPERAAASRPAYVLPDPPVPGRALHEPAAPWLPNEPEAGTTRHPSASGCCTNPEPHPNPARAEGDESCPSPRLGGGRTNPKPTRIAVR